MRFESGTNRIRERRLHFPASIVCVHKFKNLSEENLDICTGTRFLLDSSEVHGGTLAYKCHLVGRQGLEVYALKGSAALEDSILDVAPGHLACL